MARFQQSTPLLNDVLPYELRRRQEVRTRLMVIAGKFKGTGLSSAKLIREARQEAEQRGGRLR